MRSYGFQIDDDIWVIHTFQKKSKSEIKTPKQEIDMVQERLRISTNTNMELRP